MQRPVDQHTHTRVEPGDKATDFANANFIQMHHVWRMNFGVHLAHLVTHLTICVMVKKTAVMDMMSKTVHVRTFKHTVQSYIIQESQTTCECHTDCSLA